MFNIVHSAQRHLTNGYQLNNIKNQCIPITISVYVRRSERDENTILINSVDDKSSPYMKHIYCDNDKDKNLSISTMGILY